MRTCKTWASVKICKLHERFISKKSNTELLHKSQWPEQWKKIEMERFKKWFFLLSLEEKYQRDCCLNENLAELCFLSTSCCDMCSHTCTQTHTCIHAHTLMYTYTHICTYILIHTHTCTHSCTHTHMHVLTHTCTQTHALTYAHRYSTMLKNPRRVPASRCMESKWKTLLRKGNVSGERKCFLSLRGVRVQSGFAIHKAELHSSDVSGCVMVSKSTWF